MVGVRLACASIVLAAIMVSTAGASNPWARLHRPLHIPHIAPGSPCPVSPPADITPLLAAGQGNGPIYPIGWATGFTLAFRPEWGSIWGGNKVLWAGVHTYRGPVLIRGRQLDGTNIVRFGDGTQPAGELRLDRPGAYSSPPWSGRLWPTYTRLRAPGCYGWQIDGTTFSRVVVFSATLSPSPQPGSG